MQWAAHSGQVALMGKHHSLAHELMQPIAAAVGNARRSTIVGDGRRRPGRARAVWRTSSRTACARPASSAVSTVC